MNNHLAMFDELKRRMEYLETATKLYRELITDLAVHKHIPKEYDLRLAEIANQLINIGA